MAKRVPQYRPPGSNAPLPRLTPHKTAQQHDRIGRTKFTSHTIWRRTRAAFLVENPLCQDCQQSGVTTAASQVHHIAKRAEDMGLAFDPSNLMALCSSCHSKRTRQGE